MRNFTILLLCVLTHIKSFSQNDSSTAAPAKIYKMHPKWQIPAAGAFIVISTQGFRALDKNASLSSEDVLKLNPNDINAFDRATATRNPSGFDKAEKNANVMLNFSIFSPIVLALDKDVRKDWVDLITLYLASQAFDNVLYFTSIAAVRRPRPRAYNTALPMGDRTGVGMSKSFFSGHVSFGATATYFAAKVYTDYHQIKGMKRVLLYTAAAVPPLLTGYFRIEAGKHFKTDVITGFIAGATSGIVVPEFFRIKDKEKPNKVSFSPYYVPGGGGATMTMAINNGRK
jgi:membrane-associated phospholipid phosphatase